MIVEILEGLSYQVKLFPASGEETVDAALRTDKNYCLGPKYLKRKGLRETRGLEGLQKRAQNCKFLHFFYRNIEFFYRNNDFFYRNVGFFYRNNDFFYRNVGFFYRNIGFFYRNIEFFYRNIGFFYRNIEFFYRNNEFFYRNIGVFIGLAAFLNFFLSF